MEHMDPVLDVMIGMIHKSDDLAYALRDLVLNTVASGAVVAAEAMVAGEQTLSEAQTVARDTAAAWKGSDEAPL